MSASMNPARIAELLAPFLESRGGPSLAGGSSSANDTCHSEKRSAEEPAVLSTAQLQDISTYIDILIRWNARINLTAVRDPEEIVTRHFGESLFAARHLFPRIAGDLFIPSGQLDGDRSDYASDREFDRGRAALQRRASAQENTGALAPEAEAKTKTVADIGTGAGFPGLPIKIWAPDLALTLIESNHKKATFLREVVRALTLTNVDIQNTRAETLTASTFDVVTVRAVERFESILPVAAAMVSPAGRLALLISTPQRDQTHMLLPHLTWAEAISIPNSQSRIFLVGKNIPPEPGQKQPGSNL
jgi:16S rRNA (guanine527-N7)-methyltransferase